MATSTDETDLPRPFLRTYVGWRGLSQVVVDSAAWLIGLTLGALERYDFRASHIDFHRLLFFALLAGLVQVLIGTVVGLYLGRWRIGSREEAGALAADVVLVAAILFLIDDLFRLHPVPLSSVIGGGFCALVLMGGTRYEARRVLESRRRPSAATARLIIFGAGEGGTQAVDAMLGDTDSPYLPVALLDDAPSKRTLRIRGLRVEGGRAQLVVVAAKYQAEVMLIAIPSADRVTIADLTELGRQAGLTVKVLPPVSELFGAGVEMVDIRDVSDEDLLGRGKVDTDVASIAGYLTGKRVLVTGAGGSIGAELCRQISAFTPSQLVMVDRDESALHALQLMLDGRALLDSPNLVLADIRDRECLFDVFREHQPQVVFHAAALKHLTLLEKYPREAVQTNVWGSLNALEAAAEVGVDHFVNISTDKAADPISVLGSTKRLVERMTAHIAWQAEGTFLSVRFGNVLGSRGSALIAFRAQAAAGGPLTVTDPNVTRYFMTISEAVELVIQAGAIGRSGEVLVLDMGQPVRIADVAGRFAKRSSSPLDIVFTGLRPGEKLHEVLLAADETDARPFHPLISQVAVPPLDPALTESLGDGLTPAEVAAALIELSRCSSAADVALMLRPGTVGLIDAETPLG